MKEDPAKKLNQHLPKVLVPSESGGYGAISCSLTTSAQEEILRDPSFLPWDQVKCQPFHIYATYLTVTLSRLFFVIRHIYSIVTI